MTDPTPATAGRGLTVQGWFNLVLAIMTLLVVAGAVAGATVLHRNSQITDGLTDHLMPASGAAYRLQTALVNQETGVRGYALTANTSFLDPYREGVRDEQQAAGRIRELLADHPELLADLDSVEQAVQFWRSAVVVPGVDGPPAADGPAAGQRYDLGKELFDAVRGTFEQQNRNLADAVSDAQDRVDRMRAIRNAVFSALAVTLVVAAGVFAVLVRTAVTNPLSRLAASSRLVAQGKFEHRVDAGRGPADIRALAADIEQMRLRIVTELGVVRARQTQLEDQTRRLDLQTEELRRSNAELEQFAYVASHDLQEPLRKVASFCQLLDKRYGDVLDDRGRQYIDFAVDGARRMQALISDLLAFSRVGRIGDAVERISLDTALDRALANLAVTLEDTGAHVDRPEHLPEVDGDPLLLSMLWQNLVGNAVKFTRAGVEPRITITVDRRAETWQFSVQDNGIGVPKQFADKIFLIFQRLHTREEYAGTGIGLALCKKIVDYHGGAIWLDTADTEGARFCFTLPAAATDTDTDEGTRP